MTNASFIAGIVVGSSTSVLALASIAYYFSHRRKTNKRKILHLVGAGPGDPELLTLAAVRALENADLIVADFLTPMDLILRFARKDAKIIIANNKTKGNAHEAQEEIQQWTLEGLLDGMDVVRLKGGDPFLYGRGGEEALAFTKMGFQVEVIPGISSSMAGPLSAGIPVTMRGHADQFMVCTLHGKRDALYGVPSPYRANRTLVFLMSVSRIHLLVAQLLESGYPEDLPMAIVERAMLPGGRVLRDVTVGTVLHKLEQFHLQSPSIIMVGGTAGGCGLPTHNLEWSQGGLTFL